MNANDAKLSSVLNAAVIDNQWSASHTKKMYSDSEFLGRLSILYNLCTFRKLQIVNVIISSPLDGSVTIEYRPRRN
jgi:hypothetical protein